MRKQVEETTAAAGAPRRATGAAVERDRRGQFSARRKRATVLRLLRGEELESVSRELGITAARASQWRDQFLAAGQAGLKSRGLMGGVVDNGQALHDPPIRRAIEDEVRGPDLVATLGAHQGLAVGSRDLLASTALQLEPGLRVQAIDPCVIDDVAGLPQLQIDHPGPIASMSLRQVNDPIPDDRIAIGPWYVPEGRRAHLPHGQGPALTEAPRTISRTTSRRTGAVTIFFAAPRGLPRSRAAIPLRAS